ncbi:MAG: hypothetical protein HN368_10850 [Spirochaetales bacterium]|nr:hypothetical protein [Spirochaetales bacterium]
MKSGRSVMQIRAVMLKELINIASIQIPPHWSLAGEHLVNGQSASFGFSDGSAAGDSSEILDLGVDIEDLSSIRDAVESWTTRRSAAYASIGESAVALSPGQCTGWSESGVFRSLGWIENHSVRDYSLVLHEGFMGIRGRIDRYMKSASVDDPDFPKKENAWKSFHAVSDAGMAIGNRYAQAALDLARETDDSLERQRFQRMAEVCRKVPEHPAETFFEAVQSLWFAHILTGGEDGINANSLGRLDQILFPFYQADLAAGRLSRDQAVEIMEELACKLYLDYDVQAIVLGGIDADGADAVNDLTYVILDATERAGFVRDLSVRLHSSSPAAFVKRSCELIVRGGGIPFIFNDDCFVPALSDRGIPLADARGYAPIGCIELTIPGKANPHAVSGWFNALKCLELALFDGRDPISGEQWGPNTGILSDHPSFDSFYKAYTAQVEHMASLMVYHCNRGELAQQELGPLPYWSLLTDDCIARGQDITDGGCLYNYHSICFMGTANVADSLAALKTLVFENRSVDPADLIGALSSDFGESRQLRRLLVNEAPKYGNDAEIVDQLAARVAGDFIDLMDRKRSPLGGRYFVHLFTWRLNIDFGKAVGATPDGRLAREPLSYSLSAHQGRDKSGVTAMLKSLSRLPHSKAAGASAAIIDLDPQLISGESGVELLQQLVAAAIEMGVGQLQWNIVSEQRLRIAQKDPDRYGNIPVRVAGYSQIFNLIDPEIQEHIIARTKHRE